MHHAAGEVPRNTTVIHASTAVYKYEGGTAASVHTQTWEHTELKNSRSAAAFNKLKATKHCHAATHCDTADRRSTHSRSTAQPWMHMPPACLAPRRS